MKIRTAQVVRLSLFCITGLACASFVANTLSVPVRGDTASYSFEFTDVEGLNPGNPVTMSGVRIGRVDSVAFADNGGGTSKAIVDVEIESQYSLASDVRATVRYGDMLGARYLALTHNDGAQSGPASVSARTLEPGGTVPLTQTTPPINLTALMNGFKPLFAALQPEQVNTLTRSFVETFNGQGGAISALLDQIAAMTSGLVDRQDVFAQLLTNMNTLLTSVDDRQPEMVSLLDGLNDLSTSVVEQNDQLAALLDQGNRTVSSLAQLMTGSNGSFSTTVAQLENVTAGWIASTDEFNRLVANLPQFADAANRIGSYGSFINLYLCNFTLKAGDVEANIFGATHSPVCS
ncbi:MCE family protein [Rhodococcus globerulus]|uniref:MCE family protein n=1 Tax=Rhodococcus globerulus TaxID=33008 RepID=UPI001F3214EE|nr:MCE family protein [Rhodococcus globerulus]MCE4264742.1 MCE family protein [Rhodococcus globerulus]